MSLSVAEKHYAFFFIEILPIQKYYCMEEFVYNLFLPGSTM